MAYYQLVGKFFCCDKWKVWKEWKGGGNWMEVVAKVVNGGTGVKCGEAMVR